MSVEDDNGYTSGAFTVLPAPDFEKLAMEDSKHIGGPFRYGVAIPAADMRLGSKDFGNWSNDGDSMVWQWEVVSPAAKSLDFHFSRLQLPLGASLRITGEGKGNHRQIEAKDITGTAYASPYVLGERAHFELRVPVALRGEVELELASVTHGYRGLVESFEVGQKSGSCNVDTACPAGDAWRDQIDSVGHYTFSQGNSSYVCTGTLIGNTATSTTPYFLTANHCMSSQTVVGSIVVYWNYQSSTCRTPGSSASGTPLSRTIATHTQSGATLRATNSASDFSLIELNTAVPSGANPYWSGWDRSGATPSSAVGIHHPAGHEKRIAVENHALSAASYLGNSGSGTTHWRVADWDQGTTEGGSSGSGLWDQNKRLVGQLHGGYAACGNNSPDWYGRLSVSWTGGGNNASRLSNWLDSAGTGAATINGYRADGGGGGDTTPPTTPSNFSATATSASAIGLSWSASTDSGGSGLSGYRIERCSGASCSNFAQIATTASTSFSNTGLAAGTTYRYRIRAYDGAGNTSSYSSIAQATTQSSGGGGSVLANGVTVTGLSGSSGTELRYTLEVPSGASNLQFAISGGTGDADLYVRYGSAPTTSTYNCRPYLNGNNETCSVASPQAGTWHVMVRGYTSFSGVSLVGSYTAGGGSGPSFFENTTSYAIPDNNNTGVSSPITVSGRSGNAPSNLQVAVDIRHTYIGDLIVDLVAPNGTVYNLHNRTGGSTSNIITTYTVNASSVAANGTWLLRVRDRARQDTGYINSWSLQF